MYYIEVNECCFVSLSLCQCGLNLNPECRKAQLHKMM